MFLKKYVTQDKDKVYILKRFVENVDTDNEDNINPLDM